jgi:hypothetical protein
VTLDGRNSVFADPECAVCFSCRFTVFEFLAIAVCEGSFHMILAHFYPRDRAHDFWQAELLEKRFCDGFVVLRFCAGFRVQVSVSICSFWKLNAEGVICVCLFSVCLSFVSTASGSSTWRLKRFFLVIFE